VDLTNTYLSYYSSDNSTSTPMLTTIPSISNTKPTYAGDSVTALLTKIDDFMKQNDSREKVVCENKTYCGKKGHRVKDCFAYGGGLAGQYPDWWKGLQNIHLYPNECKNQDEASKATPSANTAQPQANTGVVVYQRPHVVL
jgi:hypothetical protein